MDKSENCADCGKKFGFTERIFRKTNGFWICEDCVTTQLQEKDSYKLRYELAGANEEIARLREENEKLKTEIEEIKKLEKLKNGEPLHR